MNRTLKRKKLYDVLHDRANEILQAEMPKSLLATQDQLSQARLGLKQITTLSAIYRLTKDTSYLQRAKEVMLQVASFPDWGPKNFLCVAETTASMSIGYDWLFDCLTEVERKKIKESIIEKGLRPGIEQYKGSGWWRTGNSNWNFVCNGGLSMGALALADEEPEIAAKTIACSVLSVPLALETCEPDGGWNEGPGYWAYGTRYLAYYLSSLQSSLSTDYGLSDNKGLSLTGLFRIYTEGTHDQCFNFADSDTEVPRGAQMFWFSKRYKQPVYAGAELHVASIFPEMFHLLYFASDHVTPAQADLPLNKIFTGVNVGSMRTSWTDPAALFVGFKGGDNAAHHAHLDLGTFVFDALGYRWAMDFGPDNYDLPGYFADKRWTYYRLRTEGHNTLTIGKSNQNPAATAKILDSNIDSRNPWATVDLTAAYAPQLEAVTRGIKLIGKNCLLIEDELVAPAGNQKQAQNVVPVQWHLHTAAKVTTSSDGRSAVLTQNGKNGPAKVYARIIEPKDAVFEPAPAKSPPEEMQQPDVTDLIVPLNLKPGSSRIALSLSVQDEPDQPVTPLSGWKH